RPMAPWRRRCRARRTRTSWLRGRDFAVREPIMDLDRCDEFALAMQARPPKLAHGVLLVLVVLLGTAVTWGALTEADLVVRAPGRGRRVSTRTKVVAAAHGDSLAAGLGGRVVEVGFQPGDEVRAGDVLVRLDTERLDNEIARRRRAIATGEEELAKL